LESELRFARVIAGINRQGAAAGKGAIVTRPLHCLFLLFLVPTANGADDWKLRGCVVDEVGQPVAGATVDHYWRSNGKQVRPDGSPIDFSKPGDEEIFHGNVGKMEPLRGATTDASGRFTLDVSRRRHSVIAMDSARRRGALVTIPKENEELVVQMILQPLVKVSGTFRGPQSDTKPDWTNVYVEILDDSTRPTDNFRVTQCSSFEARFETWLPPGKYVLNAYGNATNSKENDIAVTPNPMVVVTNEMRELDLGVLRMTARVLSFRETQIERATADGAWGDYKKHYGQQPPKWHVADARGVKKDVQLADFRGKWVLVNFWGLSCPHCLMDDLPRLMKFYESHAAQRDKFEILAYCMDCDNGLKTIADLDKALAPVVKHVWNGKTLPFPVLLDPSFTTMQRYGFRAYGTLLLIDPEGNLVEGNEKTLAEHLNQ